jgi:hypothetical protein
MNRDPLEYVLNRMEAERDKPPPTVGYPAARKELLDGIAALRSALTAALRERDEARGQLCGAREALQRVRSVNGTWCGVEQGYFLASPNEDEKQPCGKCVLCITKAALSSSAPCSHAERVKALEEAVEIPIDEVGRIMHESWTRTKRAQGFHFPNEVHLEYGDWDKWGAHNNLPCGKCHFDLIPWEQLGEQQKDINRHAFDDVLAALRRRAGKDSE